MADAKDPIAPTSNEPKAQIEYKVADVLSETLATLHLDDGRVISAEIPEKFEVKRGDVVTIKFETEDKGGAPADAVITKVK